MTPYHITTPDAAEILGRPDLARLLKPFMRGPKSVSAVAKSQGVSVESLRHRVQQLHRAGLRRVVDELPRRGRPIKLYEAVATDFVFSVDLLKPETLRELSQGDSWLREFRQEMERLTAPHQQRSVRVLLTDAAALMWGTADPSRSSRRVLHAVRRPVPDARRRAGTGRRAGRPEPQV